MRRLQVITQPVHGPPLQLPQFVPAPGGQVRPAGSQSAPVASTAPPASAAATPAAAAAAAAVQTPAAAIPVAKASRWAGAWVGRVCVYGSVDRWAGWLIVTGHVSAAAFPLQVLPEHSDECYAAPSSVSPPARQRWLYYKAWTFPVAPGRCYYYGYRSNQCLCDVNALFL